MREIDWSHPVNQTGVISSTRDALEKLWWNLEVLQNQLSAKDGGQGQGFAIVDYAVASGSLHAWFCAEYKEGVDAARIAPTLGAAKQVSDALRQRVRYWSVLQAIANAAKHRTLSSYWPGGINTPVLRPDDASAYVWEEDSRQLDKLLGGLAEGSVWYENVFHTPGSSSERVFAREALAQNYGNWHALVYRVGPDF